MPKLRFGQSIIALLLCLGMLCQGTMVLAGTTGTLTGTLTDSSGTPIAAAKVTAASPSQSATVTTDGTGHFTFLSLTPDTYTVSAEAKGFETSIVTGVTITADTSRSVPITASKATAVIGRTTSRANSDLVRPGTTADVYSINETQSAKLAPLGGGGNLNTAWSSIASVPGVYVAPGQSGYIGAGPSLSIRGGDYDQIGYEIDGVPVNRSFDNYPSGPASSLGQSEVQVYTGGAPANANAQGISGFINQVIKTGTSPGYEAAELSIGGPTYYNKVSFEFGGATPDKNITYYFGTDAFNQKFRNGGQFNGTSLNTYGAPLAPCATNVASCYLSNGQYAGNNPNSAMLANYDAFAQNEVDSRDFTGNIHIGIPHKDGTKDDIQLLGVVNFLKTIYADSTNDLGGAAYLTSNDFGQPIYIDGYALNLPTGGVLPANAQQYAVIYNFPGSATHAFQGNLPDALQGINVNNQGIFKLQYTKSLGANALFKVYGYTYYSNWIQNGPTAAYDCYYVGYSCSESGDYELNSHTRGVAFTFSDQLNSQNLLAIDGSFTTAKSTRDNNTEWYNGLYGPNSVNARTAVAVLVSSANPTAGCYSATGVAVSCAYTTNPAGAKYLTLQQIYNGVSTAVPATAASCGGAACEYLVVGNGQYATYNQVVPQFSSFSLTDTFKPNDKLTFDLGARFDRYQFNGSDTSGGPARALYYNDFNNTHCYNPTAQAFVTNPLGAACPAGTYLLPVTNPSGVVSEGFDVWQPRVGLTYSLDPRTVVRASYGRYAQAPNTAYEQYDFLQANAPASLYTTYSFQKYGFTTPDHSVAPPTSNNLDLSIEHQFPGQLSLKLSPFYRVTQNQIQNFFLNQPTGFVSGLNVGDQTSRGFELEVDKGNFAANGFAAKLAFAYTYSTIKFFTLASGVTALDPINQGIKQYNAYTSYCATNPTAKNCGATQTGAAAAPCYTAAGVADPACAAGDIANPYWNAPAQPLLDTTAAYAPYDTIPAGIGVSADAYGAPYVISLITQYKHDKLAITPALQINAGQRYGAPLSSYGIAPDECTGVLGAVAGDPRYPYGAPGGSSFDYSTCGNLPSSIPDPATGKFDNLGAFVEPTQLLLHAQISYEATKNVTLVANLANIVNTCFGGTKTAFTIKGACSYGIVGGGDFGGIGNAYNPGQPVQPFIQNAYEPGFAGYPFSIYVAAKFKL